MQQIMCIWILILLKSIGPAQYMDNGTNQEKLQNWVQGRGWGMKLYLHPTVSLVHVEKGQKLKYVSRLLSTIVLVVYWQGGFMSIFAKLFNLAQAMGEGIENMTGKLAVK